MKKSGNWMTKREPRESLLSHGRARRNKKEFNILYFSVFAKYLLAALALIFLSVVFSCKSAAPPAGPDSGELGSESPVQMEEAPPLPPPSDEGRGEADNQPLLPEISLSASGEISLPTETSEPEPAAEAIDGSADAGSFADADTGETPAITVPPEAPAEKKAELPEPMPLVLPLRPSDDTRQTPEPGLSPAPSEQALPQPPAAVLRPEPSQQRPEPSQPSAVSEEPPPSMPAEPESVLLVREPVPLPELPSRILPETGEQIAFSRIVRLTVGQILEIPFRGAGWVYLGELGNRRGLSYESRRLDVTAGFTEGQSFIFRAERAGTYVLKFYKQDFILDYIINDYVQVIVGERSEDSNTRWSGSPVDQDRVIAEPRWPPVSGPPSAVTAPPPVTVTESAAGPVAAAEPAAKPQDSPAIAAVRPGAAAQNESAQSPAPAAASAPAAAPETRPRQTTADNSIVPVRPPQAASAAPPPDELPAEYVRRARQEFDAGRVEAALSIMDSMRQRYPAGTDEAWWLYGQLLEANSPSRDIRLALEYYRRLVREYPQSPRAGDAQQRIAYLERFYFNIR